MGLPLATFQRGGPAEDFAANPYTPLAQANARIAELQAQRDGALVLVRSYRKRLAVVVGKLVELQAELASVRFQGLLDYMSKR